MKMEDQDYATAFAALFRLHDDGGESGYVPTAMEDIKLFWNRAPVPRSPRTYDPGIVLIGQGHKIGYKGNRTFRYDRSNGLVLSLPSLFESETIASAAEPLIGLFVNIDRRLVLDLVETIGADLESDKVRDHIACPSFDPLPIEGRFQTAATRLIEALSDPIEAKAIGAALKRELVYHALFSSAAPMLLALARDGSLNARIAKALQMIHRRFADGLTVNDMASEAGMSVSSFHRGFRDVTGDSPLQYLKKLRLHKARTMLAMEGRRAGEVASEVGYESVSQFSREFRRHFAVPPSATIGNALEGL